MEVTLNLSDRIFKYMKDLLLFLMVCGILYGINPIFLTSEIYSGSTSSLLPYIYVFLVSYLFGELSSLLHFPKILGMIIGGLVLGNVIHIQFNPELSSILRNIALATILIEGGLGLDPSILRRTSWVCLQLCLIPLITDTAVTGICGYLILDLPVIWSFMLGFILSAACAAITVPCMMDLIKKSLGTNKGIPSIILAAASMDDVIAIAGFGVLLGYAFDGIESNQNSGNNTFHTLWLILKGPVEILAGITFGYFFGLLIGTFPLHLIWPSSDSPTDQMKTKLTRVALVLLSSLACIFISQTEDMAGIGPLAVLTGSFFAGIKFRRTPGVTDEMSESIHIIWTIMQPFLFGLMGAELKVDELEVTHLAGAVIVVTIGIICRIVFTYCSLFRSNLNGKEKLFISIAWLAKAAVQATLSPIALDIATKKSLTREIEYGKKILTVSVIAVLISTPIATLGLKFLPKRLLTDEPPPYCPSSHPNPEIVTVSGNSNNSNNSNRLPFNFTFAS